MTLPEPIAHSRTVPLELRSASRKASMSASARKSSKFDRIAVRFGNRIQVVKIKDRGDPAKHKRAERSEAEKEGGAEPAQQHTNHDGAKYQTGKQPELLHTQLVS